MSVVGLHPEELLDKRARGAITEPERVRLEAHMEQCAACRVEQQMRADFAGELEGEDERISVSKLVALAALAGASKDAGGDAVGNEDEDEDEPAEDLAVAGLPRRGVLRSRRRVTRATWLLAAAAVFVASVAGAAGATGIGQRAWSRLVGEAAPAETAVIAAKRVAPKHVAHRAIPAPAPAPVETHDVLAAPQPVQAAPAPARAHATTTTAASVFEAANEARSQGNYTRSLGLHRELESRFPTSPEAHVSRATTGQLLLDLGDPTGALASFDGYLATGSGELGEEAMVGRATALERLGRADDARRAWQALLAAFPDSPYAAHAKRRLSSR